MSVVNSLLFSDIRSPMKIQITRMASRNKNFMLWPSWTNACCSLCLNHLVNFNIIVWSLFLPLSSSGNGLPLFHRAIIRNGNNLLITHLNDLIDPWFMLLDCANQLKVNSMLLRVWYRQEAVNNIVIFLKILNSILFGQPS